MPFTVCRVVSCAVTAVCCVPVQPAHLYSPTWVLQTQMGTCFESSTLLCGLLLGAGYNAYCVSGYAVKEMCMMNQTKLECPLLAAPVKVEFHSKPKRLFYMVL